MDASNDAATHWISFLEHDLLGIGPDDPSAAEHPLWRSSYSTQNDSPKTGQNLNPEAKKRAKEECPIGSCKKDCQSGGCGKACREKMRRERLNDRFMELSAILEPDKPPKTDKASILRDAARILGQLRSEVQQLREVNHQLNETIRELKAEKNELRDEKTTLKCEKERLEMQLKSNMTGLAGGYITPAPSPHRSALMHSSYNIQNESELDMKSGNPYDAHNMHYPVTTSFSQWMTPATIDISNDHILRPPVA